MKEQVRYILVDSCFMSYLNELFMHAQILDDQTFSLLLITMLLVSGLARPMVRFLYDPSRRYTAPYGRRTILQSLDTVQLRILVCINQEDNVPMILNLLEASNSTRFSPISIFVLHLVELTGSASAILVPHHHLNKTASNATSSEHVVGAFTQFEQQHLGSVVVQHFTAVAPYASMHNDICSLALDKRTTIVIVPFHKQWAIDGRVGASAPSIRMVNRNVINMAPCSVGVLIERGNNARGHRSALTTTSSSSYRIGLLFFGGADDLEALAYSRRMAQHPRVNLTVVRFIHESQFYAKEKNIEDDLIREFKANANKEKNQYKEEIVEDGVETTQAIHAMEDDFDLVMVGRYHEPDSPLMLGLTTEWSDCPELGVIGDMLTNLDQSQFSVLVVQQQPQEAGHCPPLQTIPSLPISNRSKSLASKVNSEFSDDEDFTPTYARFEQGK
jgi:nucleotide-binding universal stress UspA family protein